jgi:glycerol-3-phosphate dehydrogenase
MRIAPHLVHPLPVLIPTYGHGTRGKEVLSMAVLLTRLIGFDQRRTRDPLSGMPPAGGVSRQEVLDLLPGIEPRGLTGGVIFFDAQVYNSERLVISFLRSAAEAGAILVNYAEVIGFLEQAECVTGVRVRDSLSGDQFTVRGRTVVLVCGPWIDRVRSMLTRHRPKPSSGFAKAINIVTRLIFNRYAVGVSASDSGRVPSAVERNPNRLFFIAPWRDRSLIGTAYVECKEGPDGPKVTGADVQEFLHQVNIACRCADLKRDEIAFVHGGLVPLSSRRGSDSSTKLANHYEIRDHRDEGLQGLVSVIGVKYTTARDVAEKTVDHVFRSWGRKPPKSRSSLMPLHGGHIERFDAFLQSQIAARPNGISEKAVRRLVYNYGSAYPEVLRDLHHDGRGCAANDRAVLQAEVVHGVRTEMAQTLSDMVFRRTELGTAGHPGHEAIQACADMMRAELGWSAQRTRQELQEVENVFSQWR